MGLKNETSSSYDTKAFYKEYVEGMDSRQLGKQFHSDSERLKKLYQDAWSQRIPQHQNPDDIPFTQKSLSLLSALTKRLNPIRRLVFGISILAFFSHYLISMLGLTGFVLHPMLLPVSFIGILLILLIELLEKSDVQKELDFARNIQLSLLPASMEYAPQLEVFSFAATAREVGGDYLDIIKTEKGTYVIIADVSGKGMSAALYMVRIQALVNLLINKLHPTPKDLFLELNDYIKSNKKDKTFITACAVYFPHNEDYFTLARAGHNTPIVFNRDLDATYKIDTDGFALGMTTTANLRKNLVEKRFKFNDGDSLLLYTDGLIEARNDQNEEFGLDRLDGLFSIYGSLRAKTITQKIQTSVEIFIGDEKPADDITFTTIHKMTAAPKKNQLK